ncbi:MAG: insulinase family protein [Myxococcales bacterium]|nr:insulinase family protein [Myxococcales bacterium]
MRRHRLDNGLCLVSVRDTSAPIIAYQSWFSVGSRHESEGRTGMCHFFEHLMFNETKSLPVGEFDRRIEAIGGDTNAATWVDWTFYRASIPKSALELIVSLEAKRMTELVLSPKVVEAEREVVVNERLQCIHDDVDGFAGQELFRHAFNSHAYRWPTIGWMEDIKSLCIEDMEKFYRDYYAPNNLTLVVVGDFEDSELLAHIEAQYGALESSGVSPKEGPAEPAQFGERRHAYRKPVNSARVLYGYKAPPQSHPDWPLISFSCQLLAGSASSPLHRELVIHDELASSISCEVLPFGDASLIELSATATREHSLEQLQEAIDTKLRELTDSPIPQSEVDKVANQVETEFWGSLTTVDGKAESLGHYQCVHGDFRALFEMAKQLSEVDASDVQRILREYFTKNTRTVICIEPETED